MTHLEFKPFKQPSLSQQLKKNHEQQGGVRKRRHCSHPQVDYCPTTAYREVRYSSYTVPKPPMLTIFIH